MTEEPIGDPVPEPGSDELLGEQAVTEERTRVQLELTADQVEELEVVDAPPADTEPGEQHPTVVPPQEAEHPEYDPTPPADDDYVSV